MRKICSVCMFNPVSHTVVEGAKVCWTWRGRSVERKRVVSEEAEMGYEIERDGECRNRMYGKEQMETVVMETLLRDQIRNENACLCCCPLLMYGCAARTKLICHQ